MSRDLCGNLADLFFGYLQPPIDDNSEDLANLISLINLISL